MNRRNFMTRAATAGVATLATGSLAAESFDQRHGAGAPGLLKEGLLKELDASWQIARDAADKGLSEKWYRGPVSGAVPARVPGILQEAFPGYHGLVWYWCNFEAQPNALAHGRYLLHFGSVDYRADVWLNDVLLGTHEGEQIPLTFDVTSAIQPGPGNRLALRLLNPGDVRIDGIVLDETPHINKVVDFAPGKAVDFGGILRPVTLETAPPVRIADVWAQPDWRTGDVRIRTAIVNTEQRSSLLHHAVSIAEAGSGRLVCSTAASSQTSPGDGMLDLTLRVDGFHPWSLKEPFLYRVTVRIEAAGGTFHEQSVPCGFRDFRMTRGYFELNGRRLFLRSTHTGNHCPYSQAVPPPAAEDLLRLDMLYAKSSGFNMVRALSGTLLPYQLYLCDQIGLLVYEESRAAWQLHDSPRMREVFEASVRGMIERDRNHPCVAIWGMLNETLNGPVFGEAAASLPLVRSLDPTRLVLLSSGRWDAQLNIGSMSNPGSLAWEFQMGQEAADAKPLSDGFDPARHGLREAAGDVHFYPDAPLTPETQQFIRTLGAQGHPVFLSETGIGSMMDVIHEARAFEQAAIPANAEDYILVRSMADHFIADWQRWGMDSVYPFPEDLLHQSQRAMARHRLLIFNLVRSNPKLSGYNLTGMLDHGYTGEGLWRFWRDFKPGVMDAVQDGWAPVRWCLFATPTHAYTGEPVHLEAVLANEDVLRPGPYAASFKVWGPSGLAWERSARVEIPAAQPQHDRPLAVPVLSKKPSFAHPGAYRLVPHIREGAAPPETSWAFHISEPARFSPGAPPLTLWGVEPATAAWIEQRGASTRPFEQPASGGREVIVVGGLPPEGFTLARWTELARRMAQGSHVLFLDPACFLRDKNVAGWLPLASKGDISKVHNWLYHAEAVAKPHPLFDGLQGNGMLDWYYYGEMIPALEFSGQQQPGEVIAASFATGYPVKGGYMAGVLAASYPFGQGHFLINTFPVLQNLGRHPVADRLLVNMVSFARRSAQGPPAALPANFEAMLSDIAYR